MNFRIADMFIESLGRLTADEQKAAKTTAFDLQVNPASPGLQFHKFDKATATNSWLVRVGSVAQDAGMEDVHNTERRLLYVACTRARDHLLVSGVKPAPEYLDDLK